MKNGSRSVWKTNRLPNKPTMNTPTRLIELTQGKFAVVDECDYESISKFSWSVMKNRTWYGYVYYAIRSTPRPNRKTILMHHEIAKRAGLPDAREYDHADRDGLNNTRQNIRLCSRGLNNANRGKRPGTTSKYKGVHWNASRSRWIASIQVNGKMFFLGRFDDEKDAANAYAAAALKYFGEFARLV